MVHIRQINADEAWLAAKPNSALESPLLIDFGARVKRFLKRWHSSSRKDGRNRAGSPPCVKGIDK